MDEKMGLQGTGRRKLAVERRLKRAEVTVKGTANFVQKLPTK